MNSDLINELMKENTELVNTELKLRYELYEQAKIIAQLKEDKKTLFKMCCTLYEKIES